MTVDILNNDLENIGFGEVAFSEASRNVVESDLICVNEGNFFNYAPFAPSFCVFGGKIVEFCLTTGVGIDGLHLYWRVRNASGDWSPYVFFRFLSGISGITELFCASFSDTIAFCWKTTDASTTLNVSVSNDLNNWVDRSLTVPAGSNNFKALAGKNWTATQGRSKFYIFYKKTDNKVYHVATEKWGIYQAERLCPPGTITDEYCPVLDDTGKIDIVYQPAGTTILKICPIMEVWYTLDVLVADLSNRIEARSLKVFSENSFYYLFYKCFSPSTPNPVFVKVNRLLNTVVSAYVLDPLAVGYFSVFVSASLLLITGFSGAKLIFHDCGVLEDFVDTLGNSYTSETNSIFSLPDITFTCDSRFYLSFLFNDPANYDPAFSIDLIAFSFPRPGDDLIIYFRPHLKSEMVVGNIRTYILDLWRFDTQEKTLTKRNTWQYLPYNRFTDSKLQPVAVIGRVNPFG